MVKRKAPEASESDDDDLLEAGSCSFRVEWLCQGLCSSLPRGPSYRELFSWPSLNAAELLGTNPHAEFLKQSFKRFVENTHRIILQEDYGGTGNCGTSLVLQYQALLLEAHVDPGIAFDRSW